MRGEALSILAGLRLWLGPRLDLGLEPLLGAVAAIVRSRFLGLGVRLGPVFRAFLRTAVAVSAAALLHSPLRLPRASRG